MFILRIPTTRVAALHTVFRYHLTFPGRLLYPNSHLLGSDYITHQTDHMENGCNRGASFVVRSEFPISAFVRLVPFRISLNCRCIFNGQERPMSIFSNSLCLPWMLDSGKNQDGDAAHLKYCLDHYNKTRHGCRRMPLSCMCHSKSSNRFLTGTPEIRRRSPQWLS
ncbi:hypothetical protein OG21DRAFT_1119400 [Imleria badia]|nr:hypothetical protein OG21DRAFT_1119400 [Imleria badia]